MFLIYHSLKQTDFLGYFVFSCQNPLITVKYYGMSVKNTLPKELSLTQASSYLGLNRQTIWNAIQKGRIKARKVGHVFVIPRKALDKYKSSPKPVGGRPRKVKKPLDKHWKV